MSLDPNSLDLIQKSQTVTSDEHPSQHSMGFMPVTIDLDIQATMTVQVVNCASILELVILSLFLLIETKKQLPI